MLLKNDYYKLYHNSTSAYEVEIYMNSAEDDIFDTNWKYTAVEKFGGWVIEVHDENNIFLGYL